jgi:voltage-gated potassium channel
MAGVANTEKEKKEVQTERWKLLTRVKKFLDRPMIFLAFAWLSLIIVDLTKGLPQPLQYLSTAIWIIFIIDFIISFIVAPEKKKFLKKNLLILFSLLVPAFRIFRLVGLARSMGSLRLVKVLASLNRGMRGLAATMAKRVFLYMFSLSMLVLFAGAAGMFAFEGKAGGFKTYSDAVWWTAMMILTIGCDYWPSTPEGRILCCVLALFGFGALGYMTASLASFFVGKDAKKNVRPANSTDIENLKKEIEELKRMLQNGKGEA